MKKKIVAAVVIAGIGLAGLTQAFAWGPRGGGYGGFNGNCPQYQGGQYNQADPALQEKMDKFYTDTQELRKELMMKQAERQALVRADNPDPATMSKLAGELFDLRAELQQKADEAGLPGMMGPRSGRGGFGPGMRGPGRGGQNRMMGGQGFGGPRS